MFCLSAIFLLFFEEISLSNTFHASTLLCLRLKMLQFVILICFCFLLVYFTVLCATSVNSMNSFVLLVKFE